MMKLKPIFVFVVTFHCFCAEHVPGARPSFEEDIIGGTKAPWYPFFVRVISTNTSGESGELQLCGGTIIGPKLILTAAHCVDGYPKEAIKVVHTNFTDPSRFMETILPKKFYGVEVSIVHKEYNTSDESNSVNDVALLKLKKAIDLNDPNIEMLSLFAAGANYDHATAIGLGLINQDNGDLPRVLMEAQLDWQPECGSFHGFVDSTKQVCFSVPGEKSACNGDSGGPLVAKEDGKVKCLLGIPSFTCIRCTSSAYPGVFGRAG